MDDLLIHELQIIKTKYYKSMLYTHYKNISTFK